MFAPPGKERLMKATVLALTALWAGPIIAQPPPPPPQHAAPRTELTAPRAESAGASRSPRARQLAQLVSAALAAQVAPLLVPGAEHDALCRTALGLDVMHARAVRVPVDHAPHPGGPKRRGHRGGIHVHDVGYRARGVPPAAGARLIRQQLAVRARQGEEALLPVAAAHQAAQLLIGMIVGAQRIAVREQHLLAIELRHHRIGEQAAATALAETLTEQEVAVAVQREAGDAAP